VAFLQGIRTSIGEYFLRKELNVANRSKSIINLKDAKTIAIIYNADNINDVELIRKYISYLRDLGKKVWSLGYVPQKEMPGNITTSIDHRCFTMKDINWYYKPATNIIANFVNEEYDLLLDLNIAKQLPLTFTAALSKAKCKVGRYSEKYLSLYDVMLETDDEKTLQYFLKNVDTYMEMLNKKAEGNTIKRA